MSIILTDALKGLSPDEYARRAMHNGRRLTLVVDRKRGAPHIALQSRFRCSGFPGQVTITVFGP